MKLLWVGDACCSSGFAKCTHSVCDWLHHKGWDIEVLGVNYYGDPHSYEYPIYAAFNPLDGGGDVYGVQRLRVLSNSFKPDVVVILNDPWNVSAYLDSLEQATNVPSKVVAWLAVDAENQNGEELCRLSHLVTWTSFAEDELRKSGYAGDSSIVPLGVDTKVFYPRDRNGSRKELLGESISVDSFIVGVVGRNQPRKRIDLAIESFAQFCNAGEDDAYLYLYVAPTGDMGCDLRSLVRYYGLKGKVLLSEPHIGVGVDELKLAELMCTFSMYLNTSQGEGWGLPCLECMASGVPCVVLNFSGLGSWVEDAALKVDCGISCMTAPVNSLMHTIGRVAKAEDIASAMSRIRHNSHMRKRLVGKGLEMSKTLNWNSTAVQFESVLDRLEI